MPIDVFPDLDRPRVVILAECPGLATEEVKSLVTRPIEVAILGSSGVEAVRSQSTGELNVTYVEFDWKTDVRTARQTVAERLGALANLLPEGVRTQMAPTASIMGQIVIAGMYRQPAPAGQEAPLGDELIAGRMALRTAADWIVRPRLLKIPGIAEVFVQGGDRKQYQVLVDPLALLEHGVTLQEVTEALRESNLNSSGGFALRGETERPIRVLGRLGPEPQRVLSDLRKVAVKANPRRPILLEHVARVVEGPQFQRGDGSVNGHPGVVLTIAKQPHVDTRALTEKINAALKECTTSLPADVVIHPRLFQLKSFIDRGVYNVGEALLIGALLVLIILLLFLQNLRTTFITLVAIPISLAVTAIVFRWINQLTGTDLSINVMTLGGIAVAMGELVDDAIVDVENIFRRLKENAAAGFPHSALAVVYEASVEVRGAIVFGTAIVVLVFLPLFALSGVEGRLFTPLGIAYIVSILASLLVSLTVTPVLSYYLLPRARAVARSEDGSLLRLLKRLAAPLVRLSMTRTYVLMAATWLLVALSAWHMSQMGRDFLPQFDEGSVQLNVSLPPGSSLAASNQVCGGIDRRLLTMQVSASNPTGEVLHFVRRTGRAELDEHAQPVNASEYILAINPESGRSREEVLRKLLTQLREVAPGVDIEAEQPLAHLISHMLSGVNAQVAIKVFGDDIGVLTSTATQIKNIIFDIPGVTPPVVEPIQETEELHLRLRADDLAYHGVTRAHAARLVHTALQGEVVSQVLEGERRFDLLIRLDDEFRNDFAHLGRLRLDLPNGQAQVELRELADIGEGSGPNAVYRENARRRIVVRLNAQGRDLSSVVAEVERRVGASVDLPPGYFIEFGGQFESQERATTLIGLLGAFAVAGMFVVLLILCPSPRIALQILNALPTAFVGGVLALVLTGQTLTVASLVGFISLGGIAVRNGILLVSHYLHLLREEGEDFTPAMILRGSLERLAPVLMTALTAGIALLPLVLRGHQPGREILYPVATVILGGLITSTFCEFLIHPGLFWRFSGQDAERILRADTPEEAALSHRPFNSGP